MQRSKEQRTPYWGKMAGVMAGLATGRWWLALLGLILGHQFDRGFAGRQAPGRDKRSGTEAGEGAEQVPETFVRGLFLTMGFLAKSDGRVSEEEIRAARVLMHRLHL